MRTADGKWNEAEWLDPKGLGAALAERLTDRESCLQPVTDEPAEVDRFARWDLASWVAAHCAEDLDPRELRDPKVRQDWTERALEPGAAAYLKRPFEIGRRPFWIMHEGQRIGTVGFRVVPGSQFPTIDVSSLFVRPGFRRRGWATRILELVRDAAHEGGFRRVTLGTEWTNPRAVSFYLARGMYCRGWKHHLSMVFDRELPKWRVQVDGSIARFVVRDQVVGVAENRGDRLDWKLGDQLDENLARPLEATAALELAVMGWPIIRSDEAWQEQIDFGIAEFGSFENLALRIRQFDRYHASMGWFVPRRNPSFATLVQLKSVSIKRDCLDVGLSDGRELPVTFELLDPMPNQDNPLKTAHIEGDYVVCRLQSGERDEFSVDRLLGWHQSPEHLQSIIGIYREERESRQRSKDKRDQETTD